MLKADNSIPRAPRPATKPKLTQKIRHPYDDLVHRNPNTHDENRGLKNITNIENAEQLSTKFITIYTDMCIKERRETSDKELVVLAVRFSERLRRSGLSREEIVRMVKERC